MQLYVELFLCGPWTAIRYTKQQQGSEQSCERQAATTVEADGAFVGERGGRDPRAWNSYKKKVGLVYLMEAARAVRGRAGRGGPGCHSWGMCFCQMECIAQQCQGNNHASHAAQQQFPEPQLSSISYGQVLFSSKLLLVKHMLLRAKC